LAILLTYILRFLPTVTLRIRLSNSTTTACLKHVKCRFSISRVH